MQPLRLLVFGAHTYLGMEVARLGRAIGHRIVALTPGGAPRLDAPWVAGIEWVQADAFGPDHPGATPAPHALIYCATTHFDDAEGRLERHNVKALQGLIEAPGLVHSRVVYRSAAPTPLVPSAYIESTRRAEAMLNERFPDHVSLRLPLLYGSDRPDSVVGAAIVGLFASLRPAHYPPPMRVETAAIALLRAALEPEHRGVLHAPEVASLGDALYAQAH
ncbi:hypothetical protein DV096_12610 [Bradymonadaceae bacterium TMQ3]|nr:hypothetical protein DV096_12610 [Bradymonadaceae bacterium TMQ3]TXC75280.1 SDR family oxidoreductase [Bradymonadales bacterium TMQ1]